MKRFIAMMFCTCCLLTCLLTTGCKQDGVVMGSATVGYDKARDGEPKDIGPTKGGKGKGKGAGAGSPP